MTDHPVPDAEIRAALARVTASEPFRNAPQLVAFLSYVVDRTLAGATRDIKGYTIATHALGRPADFDPQQDPIVRVEAGRLRRALDAYYSGEGEADPLRIIIPRGSYVPQFEPAGHQEDHAAEAASDGLGADQDPTQARMQASLPVLSHRQGRGGAWLPATIAALAVFLALLASGQMSGWRDSALRAAGVLADRELEEAGVTIVVTPVEVMEGAPSSFSWDGLRKTIIEALNHFDDLTVIDAGRADVKAAYPYTLSLRIKRTGTIVAQLDRGLGGKSVWVRSYDPAMHQDLAGVEQPIDARLAQNIATSVARPYGIIFADLRSRPDLDPRTRCLVKSYDYWANQSAAAHEEVRGCLEALATTRPDDTLVLSRLALVYLDEYRFGYNPRPDPIDRARQAARRAIEVAPESPAANEALMAVLFATGDTGHALPLAERLLELNPYNPDLLADVGVRFVQAGHYRRGAELIRRAAAANPASPPRYDFYLFLAYYMLGEIDRAHLAAARIGTDNFALGFVARAITAWHDGDREKAAAAIERLVAVEPEFKDDPVAVLSRHNFAADIVERLVRALREAGLGS